ncbi:MAG: hypothetical protein A3I07_00780 [Candidatus Doudnabacteria bacterium RIFCSPLOWO2_02_FULL_42_9]|uniref:Uncharacterized protein n=1 Tax=Candidatus Doudnabacteria bacterium RIFCSPHIGHO2_01_FULL_41_86 TaxID=1817821 RepID=A0A1F5N9U8_9BACT|nr:MAG: hypothetical protein A2717_02790 [Candidatus Doudnabacteria bacterium RIFCSPHIGHO2_01_FULL_41_86]OGE75519.1 MAG: hypothetical protein A3K07_01120 [Candidatus Doudnabacteria bacterium RIFCSPHIGHO2_01_43_10]OGE85476.1 MAG: hypothetical protein A3E28_02360 [Candidatus Doudnabacteria bacterium RIFCSPHIGHO2_12_FULL_42_22]OGE87014.1 MAG: hypothetical protein A3C49_03195 [Candidatus Doudnabacteria bacterium RIFCSPHIGHO2_02_FULL_42_25]OGE92613.1 MAG: hypothetical protein A2895_03350 [Candidatus
MADRKMRLILGGRDPLGRVLIQANIAFAEFDAARNTREGLGRLWQELPSPERSSRRRALRSFGPEPRRRSFNPGMFRQFRAAEVIDLTWKQQKLFESWSQLEPLE